VFSTLPALQLDEKVPQVEIDMPMFSLSPRRRLCCFQGLQGISDFVPMVSLFGGANCWELRQALFADKIIW